MVPLSSRLLPSRSGADSLRLQSGLLQDGQGQIPELGHDWQFAFDSSPAHELVGLLRLVWS